MYLVPLIFPAGIALAFLASRLRPGTSETAAVWIAMGVPMGLVTVTALAYGRWSRRRAGLVPARSGFSAKVDLLAQKLRERAEEIDAAQRFPKELAELSELESLAGEVRNTAKQMDKRDVGRTLTHDAFRGGTTDQAQRADWRERAALLRDAANELSAYAEDVRARGGIYKTKPGETLGCAVVLLAMGGAGAWMVLSVPSAFGWGIALVVLTTVLGFAMVGSQTEAP
jgi:hypothetical protein